MEIITPIRIPDNETKYCLFFIEDNLQIPLCDHEHDTPSEALWCPQARESVDQHCQ
jgi:hypothetical protein